MNKRRSSLSLRNRHAGFEWVSLALAALLALPPVAFTTPLGTVSARSFGAHTNAALPELSASIVVNTTGDGSNVDPNAGCDADAATSGEQCTLRAAIQRAEVLAGDDEITFNIPTSEPNCNTMTGACAIHLSDGLQLSTNIAFNGPGADKLTVRRIPESPSKFRVFLVLSTGPVSFSGLTIAGGDVSGLSIGGGILHASTGTVSVVNSIISGNNAEGGGGIANSSSGTVNVTNSRIFGNRAGGGGAGIANSSTGTVNVLNSLISENQASSTASSSGGGGIRNGGGTVNVVNSVIFRNFVNGGSSGGLHNASGTMNISNCTITENEDGIGNDGGASATVKSTIIAQNHLLSGTEVLGSFTSAGFNVVGTASPNSGFNHPTDQMGTANVPLNPKLTNVRILGVLIPAHPECSSPTIDKGTSASLSGPLNTDVRGAGFPRTLDDANEPNAAGGDGTEVGAIERQSICPRLTFTVNKTSDADDVNPGDTICDSDAGAAGPQCTLRAALTEANAVTGDQAINFAIPATEPNCVIATGACTINLTSELPDIATINSLTISGPGADKLTVRRSTGGFYGIFTIENPFTGSAFQPIEEVSISGLTISNGATLASGGGISADVMTPGFTLNINDCKISDNFASEGGGGIAARGTLNVTDSTFSGNIAGDHGGGILNLGAGNITNSTFDGNGAGGNGGGVWGAFDITACVFTGNSARLGGGGALASLDPGDTVQVANSSFSGNMSASSFSGGIYHSFGTLNVTGTTISGNIGGGLVDAAGSAVTTNILNSTISNNEGGGIFVEFDNSVSNRLNVTNSTINGNRTRQDGGGGAGITLGRGTLNVTNSTITQNEVGGIGGGALNPGTWSVKSTIVALNTGPGDVVGAFTSGGFNLIGDPGNSTGFTNGVNNDQVGTTASPLDPQLDPAGLQNNGGQTHTIALQPTSLAIDKGTAAGLAGALTTDQRGTGFTRTFNDPAVTNAADGTDIGAFERNPAAPTPTPTPTPTATPTPTVTPTPTPTPTATPTPAVPTFRFDAPDYNVEEGVTSVNVRVLRSGPTGASAAVDLTSEDGTAKQKGDYTFVVGHLSFAAGETEKTFQVLINDDSYTEGLEFATLLLQHPSGGAALGEPNTATLQITDNVPETASNPIDDTRKLVGTHYHDFLYRQSDQAGEDFWTQQIEACGTDTACRQSKRVDVSTAFFLSTEFQQTGYFVIRSHKAAFGNIKSNPRYEVFLRDQRQIGEGVIVGQPGFQQLLHANRQKYLEDFVTRPEFVALFPQGSAAVAYVELLFTNAGASPTQTERDAAITAYGSGDTAGRAAALRSVVESGSVFNAQYNPAFVLMQYYGYLRRNPDAAPDNNFNGYDFWLAKMNSFTLPGEDARNESVALARVRRAEMVKAFIESGEYRQRFFGAAGGNQEGSREVGVPGQ